MDSTRMKGIRDQCVGLQKEWWAAQTEGEEKLKFSSYIASLSDCTDYVRVGKHFQENGKMVRQFSLA